MIVYVVNSEYAYGTFRGRFVLVSMTARKKRKRL